MSRSEGSVALTVEGGRFQRHFDTDLTAHTPPLMPIQGKKGLA